MTQNERVLSMLEEAGPEGCTTADFARAYVPRFSARIKDLRKTGVPITSERLSASSWRYRLEGLAEGSGLEDPAEYADPARLQIAREYQPDDSLFDLAPVSGTSKSAITGKVLEQ